jgi:hypothetical protein
MQMPSIVKTRHPQFTCLLHLESEEWKVDETGKI